MQTQNLQIIPKGVKPIIRASQFDVGREFQLKLYDGAVAYTPPTGTALRLDGVKPDGTVFSYTENLSLSGSTITVTTTTQMTILEGTVQCEIRMTKDNDDIGTINFDLMVEKSPINETTDLSQTEIPALVILTRMQMENAEAWAVGTKDGEPVSPDDPQYENSAKFWAEHAKTRLSGLEDVEFTSLADKQSLVYDATEQKWVNGSISASDVNYTNTSSGLEATNVQAAIDEVAAKNQTLTNNIDVLVDGSAVNKLPNNAKTQTLGGIEVTVNPDKSITISGSGNSENFDIFNDANNPIVLEKDCVYSCSATFTVSTCEIVATATDESTYSLKLSTGNKLTIPAGKSIKRVGWYNNASYDQTLTIYPMIADADYTGDYVPYAMTNRELSESDVTITPETGITIDYNCIKRVGKVVTLNFRFTIASDFTIAANAKIATINPIPASNDASLLMSTSTTWNGTNGGLLTIVKNTGDIKLVTNDFTAGNSYIVNAMYVCA